MRIILFTGKGGVGKTSVSAATALKASELGYKTLVVSTDTAHSLGDSFNVKLGNKPIKIKDKLYAQEIDVQKELEENWGMIKEHLADFLEAQGLDNVVAEELAIIPGFEELFSLIEIKENFDKKNFDVIIVDTAPTSSALRLLSFPDIVSWYVRNIFDIQKKIIKMSKRVKHMMEGNILGIVANTYDKIDGIKEILTDRKITTVRMVLNLEKMIIMEAQRAYTYLNLFGLNVDSVMVNKIIPEEVKDPYFGKWKDVQKKYLNLIKESFEPLPIFKFNLLEEELVGEEILKRFSKSIYGDLDPVEIFIQEPPIEFAKTDKENILKLKLPFVEKENVDLLQRGEELIIRVGHFKHSILLPQFLKNSSPKKAKFIGDKLNIYFER